MRWTAAIILLLNAVAVGADSSAVLVFPFTQPAADARYRFIAQALQRNIVSEISRSGTRQAIPAKSASSDAIQALAAANDQHAGFVVIGALEISASQLRITGQVLSADVGKSIG